MNCYKVVEKMSGDCSMTDKLNFFISGMDAGVRNHVLSDIYSKIGKNLIILDDSGDSGVLDVAQIQAAGYQVKNGFSGEFRLYNPLRIDSINGMTRLRELMKVMGYDEKQKQKLIAYLKFIEHIERLFGTEEDNILTLEILGSYSSNVYVEMKIQKLVSENIIDSDQQLYLLSKYSEVCDVAADFENSFYILAPFIRGKNKLTSHADLTAYLFSFKEMETDIVIKNIVTHLLLYDIADNINERFAILILDKGMGERPYILKLLTALPEWAEVYLVSPDIFTLVNNNMLSMIMNRFAVRIYSKHLAMDSCRFIEELLGEINVVKQSYAVNYDCRWSANKPLDILWGRNKTEGYVTNPSVREPKYRKEMIARLHQGEAIIEYGGRSLLVSL